MFILLEAMKQHLDITFALLIKKAFANAMEELGESAASKDGKLILDFLQAIHAAELRQADLDARAFAEEKKVMKVWITKFSYAPGPLMS